ncbi:MAG: Ig-like domain-containing protein [Alistipes sp.]
MKFIRLHILVILSYLGLILFAACSKEVSAEIVPSQPVSITGLQLSTNSLRLSVGGSASLRAIAFLRSDGTTQSLGTARVSWQTNDGKVASVTAEGRVTGVAEGQAIVTASAQGVSARVEVTVCSDLSTTGISEPFLAAQIYSMGNYLKSNAVIQGFDLARDGTIYYMQLAGSNAHQLLVVQAKPNKSGFTSSCEGAMTLQYFGHGTNYAMEENSDGIYLWVGCYASMTTNPADARYRQYWNNQTIARVKYEPEKIIIPKQCATQFYMGSYKEIHPAIDEKNDVLAINFPTSHPTEPRRFRMYRLSDAMALPLSTVTLQELTYGGGTSTDPQVTEAPKILVRDLRKLKPLGEFGIPNTALAPSPDDLSHYAWQGFEVDSGLIYYAEGEGNNNASVGSPSVAYLTIFDFEGHLVERRTKVSIASDLATLTSLGITASGYMEAEGVRVRNGQLYLGFASRDKINDAAKIRANIFSYKKVR